MIEKGQVVRKEYSSSLRQRYKFDFDPIKGSCPMFEQYLEDSFRGDECVEKIELLQQIMGGIIMGCFDRVQRAVLFYGGGNNGKSVLLELLKEFFPKDIMCAIGPELLSNEYNAAQLSGKKVNIVGEIESATKMKSAAFKDIITCETPINARHPYGRPFSFVPTAAHIFSTNSYPSNVDHTKGFYRRWVILEFKNDIDHLPNGRKKIPHLALKIAQKESPQVMAWFIEGARILIKNGFNLPLTQEHENNMAKWQAMRDSVNGFLTDTDEVRLDPAGRVDRATFYDAYRNYCFNSGVKSVSRQKFYGRIDEKLTPIKSHGSRCYEGAILVKNTVFTD